MNNTIIVRKIKWKRVLICLFVLIILIGGIIVGIHKLTKEPVKNSTSNSLKNDQTNNDDNVEQPSKQEGDSDTNETSSNLEKAPTNNQDFQNLIEGEYLTTTGHTLIIKDGIASIEGHLIVNKTYSVPQNYQPTDPVNAITTERCNNCLTKDVMDSFNIMQSDASALGLNIYIASGYRSYNYQERLYNNYTAVSGMEEADTYSARPGHSEHQTGLCFDLNSVNDSFANTAEGKWIQNNAHLYGFIIRYPKGKESITGYQYESWHLRYVGETLAEKLYNNGNWLTMEEYYGISSNYYR